MKRLLSLSAAVFALDLMSAAPVAHAADTTVELTIKDHKFQPDLVMVPANARITLKVKNEDATPEEFESHELNVEKIIPGKSKGIIIIGPLKPGTYPFVGEFHEATAKGKIVAE